MISQVRPRVIVTGSEGLIGRAVTMSLASSGYEILKLDLALGHDLTDERFVAHWFQEHHAEHLVNLFAINDTVVAARKTSSFLDVDLQSVRRCLDVNVVALLSVCREFIRNQKTGTIVNFSSIYGMGAPKPSLYSGGEKFIAYGVSKAAVIQLTRHLAVHAAPEFRVNCVVPGGVFDSQPGGFVDRYSKETPIGRMMTAQEITGMIEFLLSDKSSYCIGGVFAVDGGWTAW
jgi:NAD(P)-dependent dehydrogenase (short-subunit alcohol dehydrogenase family)